MLDFVWEQWFCIILPVVACVLKLQRSKWVSRIDWCLVKWMLSSSWLLGLMLRAALQIVRTDWIVLGCLELCIAWLFANTLTQLFLALLSCLFVTDLIISLPSTTWLFSLRSVIFNSWWSILCLGHTVILVLSSNLRRRLAQLCLNVGF